jgi:XTP/dITP diphosphohydrolase
MKKLVLSTRNQHKIREVEAILNTCLSSPVEILSLDDIGLTEEIEENGSTFEENAIIKARAAFEKSGIPSIADDSGLEVAALGGAPGIYSARYASLDGHDADDEENNKLLLKNLEGKSDRSAAYVCAIAYVDKDTCFTVRGEARGKILTEPQGNGGFGYDPYFFSDDANACFGTISAEEKNKFSHRRRALEAFAKIWEENNDK